MIKNLVVNGCSFTDERDGVLWPTYINRAFDFSQYINLARSAAGNFYIANSTINYLESNNLSPAETLVIIMWSGPGRKDIRISGEWYYFFENQYNWRAQSQYNDEGEYYLFSGGMTGSWLNNPDTKKIFNWAYKLSDPTTLCKDTLMYIMSLENYLKANGYHYRFSSFVNYWSTSSEYNKFTGDYSIDFFLKDSPVYQNFNFDPWIFVNSDRDCLGEFAQLINELDNTMHPTELGHQTFAEQIIIPRLIDSYAEQLMPHS